MGQSEEARLALLDRMVKAIEQISQEQHALSRSKEILQLQATRLRLGCSVEEVSAILKASDAWTRLPHFYLDLIG